MKKYLCALLLTIALLLTGCEDSGNYVAPEQPVLYYKDIPVTVVYNNTTSWFAGTHWYKQTITVKSDEYGLEETFDLSASGAFASMPHFYRKEGDVIEATLHSWVLESTGEVLRREIHRLN